MTFNGYFIYIYIDDIWIVCDAELDEEEITDVLEPTIIWSNT